MEVQVTRLSTISCPASDIIALIYGDSFTLHCGGSISGDLITGDWYRNDENLNSPGNNYTAIATFEAQGSYRCTGNPGTTLDVRVVGEFLPVSS